MTLLARLMSAFRGSPPQAPGAVAAGALDGSRWDLPGSPEGRREAARWAYRLLLVREPDSAASLDFLASSARSTRDLRDRILQSQEFRSQSGLPVQFSMTGDEPPQEVQVNVGPEARERLFRRVQETWHALGEEQPHWSVVTAEEFRPGRIGESLESFYASGEANVATLMRTLARNGIDASRLRRCMDFGCGVGRLTVALAKRFPEVVAVDVSASHLAVARESLSRFGIANASLHRLEAIADVAGLPAVDLVYSVIVLQHNPPPVMHALFEGLLARVAPGGAAVIQVPTYLPVGYRFDLAEYEKGDGREMEMHPLPQREVFALARAAGMEVLEVLEDAWTGFGSGSRSNTFVMRRPG